MEELVQKIDELKEILNANTMPLWASIIGVFVPIFLSIIVIIITVFQHKNNKALQILINDKNEELQKMISDKDLRVQMHGDILSIYDGNSMVQSTLGRAGAGITTILAEPNQTFQWRIELHNVLQILCQANNRAFLLLPQCDSSLREVLKNIFSKFQALCVEIDYYIFLGEAEKARQQAWTTIFATYGILINDYNALLYNGKAAETFIKLCSNEITTKMDNEVREILELFHYEKFDKYFEPYLRMYSEG